MPLPLPNLDDRNFEDLMKEALARIPTHAPEWTNHNPSDPGITLIEMFAFLTDTFLYRVNRVGKAHTLAFLKLLNGPDWKPCGESLPDDITKTIKQIRSLDRAVTSEDYEALACRADEAQVGRAFCVPGRDLESGYPGVRQGHISVVVVPRSTEPRPHPSAELLQRVKAFLEPRRLLATQIHVVGPRYISIGVRLRLGVTPGVRPERMREWAVHALEAFLHPLTGGPKRTGWPVGRSVYLSELYKVLHQEPSVVFVAKSLAPGTHTLVDELTVAPNERARLLRNSRGEIMALALEPDELPHLQIASNDIVIENHLG